MTGRVLEAINQKNMLPPFILRTRALWLEVSKAMPSAAHGVAHCLLTSASLAVFCDASDVHCVCPNVFERPDDWGRLMLFEKRPGGVGVVDKLMEQAGDLLRWTWERLSSCDCLDGCNGCVMLSTCEEANEGISKEESVSLMKRLIDPKTISAAQIISAAQP